MRRCLLASGGLVLVAILAPGVFGPVFFVRGDGMGAALFWALQFALWIAICGLFARKKRYSVALGIAGLLLVPGFLLLVLLPGRTRRTAALD